VTYESQPPGSSGIKPPAAARPLISKMTKIPIDLLLGMHD
jgi:hypothetical protein